MDIYMIFSSSFSYLALNVSRASRRAHLAARSEHFRALFYGGMRVAARALRARGPGPGSQAARADGLEFLDHQIWWICQIKMESTSQKMRL